VTFQAGREWGNRVIQEKQKIVKKDLLSYTVENENTAKTQEVFDIDAIQV
jgi:hypothetical protein